MRDVISVALLSTFLTLLILIPFGYFYSKQLAPHVAAVDLQSLIQEEKLRAQRHYSSTPSSSHTEYDSAHFAKTISVILQDIAANCGCVLVNKAAILGGEVIDYTGHVRARLGDAK